MSTQKPGAEETAIEMFVGGLVLDPNTQAPVVVLKDETGEIHLPIWIGVAEATSIASAMKDLEMSRPLTHDLMSTIFTEVGVRTERVVITDLRDGTYYSELVLSFGEKALVMDARPSDAIAVALRVHAPIYVTRSVLNQAKIALESSENAQPGSDDASAEEGKGTDTSMQDFKNIDKEKWEKILEDLDAEDFKYKM